jgi:hypothetical protein
MRGGKRTNAGRKAGTRSKRTVELIKAVESSGITPLQHMLTVMRSPMPAKMKDESPEGYAARCKCHVQRVDAMAVAAAPYVNPRLANIQHKEDEEQFKAKHEEMDLMETARRMAFIFATADDQETAH